MGESLLKYNTFGIDVTTPAIHRFESVAELQKLFDEVKEVEPLILGGGSNVLLTNDLDRPVFVNAIQGRKLVEEHGDEVLIEVGGGVVWHDWVMQAIDSGWFGIENMSLIPGSVGAAPMQNIGAYGVELKDVFHSLKAWNIAKQQLEVFSNSDCEFGYRSSVFKTSLKGQYVITHVTFKLNKVANPKTTYGAIQDELHAMGIVTPTPKDVSNAVIQIRQSKLPDPKEVGNGGSFFKNPVVSKELVDGLKETYPNMPSYPVSDLEIKVPAGWLIEQAGWKGKTFGNYGVYPKQALVLVNYGGASGQEIYQLSGDIIADVKAKFGITLEREVNLVG